MAKTANQILFDRAVRHSIFLERYKNGEVDKIVGFLNRQVLPDVTKQVQERYEGIAAARRTVAAKRLKSLQVAVSGEVSGGMRMASRILKKDLRALGVEEAAFQVNALGEAMRPIVVDFNLPNIPQINQIITREPILGQTLNGWFNKNIRDANDVIMGQVRIGLAQGESVGDVVKRLRGTAAAAFGDGTYNQIRNHMRTVVRTSANHVSTQTRETTYAENDDLIKGVQYVATLDARTTEICASLDGKVFPINEGLRPPMHHQCRSTTSPVLKSFKELGIPAKDLPDTTRAARQAEAKLSGRVPARQTYPEWLKTQSVKTQNMALGPTRAKLWREGKVTIDRFINDSGKRLSLKNLALKEGLPPIKVVRTPKPKSRK